MERNIRHRIDLRIERNQMKGARNPRESISNAQAAKRPSRPNHNALPEENAANLFTARAHGHQHGNVAGFVSDRHGEYDEDVQAGDESDQSNENGGDPLLQPKSAEQGAIFFHPGAGRKTRSGLPLE